MENIITESEKSNPKLYWKLLKQSVKTNHSKNSEIIPPLKTVINGHEKFCVSDQDKANCLNDYFSSISTVDDSNATLPTFERKTENSLSDIQTTESEIKEIIDTLDLNKAVGEDLVSVRVLKATKQSISRPLCMLFNRSLQNGVFPTLWKSAIVMPLFKKGEKELSSNYRPISLLSCIGKLMERVINKHIYNHLISNNLIYSAEASSKYPARKGISFHPLHIKGLIVSCWRPLNGQTFRPGCQVRMWILHTKIQDGVQNGHQKDEFSNFSHIGVKDLYKYVYFYVVLLRSNLKSIIRL